MGMFLGMTTYSVTLLTGKMLGKATWATKRIQLLHDTMEGRDYGQLKDFASVLKKGPVSLLVMFEP